MRVTVVTYDPDWRRIFEKIREELLDILGPDYTGTIEHVGSTAVHGLWAKPVIDIDLIVSRSYHADVIEAMVKSGQYMDQGRDETFERTNFKFIGSPADSMIAKARRNVYLTTPTALALRNHMAVRSTLWGRPDLVEEYSNVKRKLAEQDWDHIDGYVEGKSEVLAKILDADGSFSESEMEIIRGFNVDTKSSSTK